MKVFEIPATLRMDGKLERESGYSKPKPIHSHTFQQNLVAASSIKTAHLSIRFHLLPFEELFRAKSNTVLSLTISTMTVATKITLSMKRCRILQIDCLYPDNGSLSAKSQAYQMNTLIYNFVDVAIDFPFAVAEKEIVKCSLVIGDSAKPN